METEAKAPRPAGATRGMGSPGCGDSLAFIQEVLLCGLCHCASRL